jgi:hypothetical protein
MDRGELHLTGADLIATISGTDTAARVPLLSNPTPPLPTRLLLQANNPCTSFHHRSNRGSLHTEDRAAH